MWGGWGRQPPSLRDRQINSLKQNHQIVTVQEGSRYRANFVCRWGNMNFLIELPQQFPAAPPSLRFEKQVAHHWVDNRGNIISPELRSWGPHSDLVRLVNDCIKQFVAVPPTPVNSAGKKPQYQPPPPGGRGQPPQYPAQPGGFGQPPQPGFGQPPQPNYGQPPGQQFNRPPPPSYNQHNPYQPQPSPNLKPIAVENNDDLSEFDEGLSQEVEEPEPEIDPVVFPVPDTFEILDTLEEKDLNDLLKDKTTLTDWALSHATYKSAREMQESTRSGLREAAQHNLAQQQPIEDEKRRLEEARTEVDNLMMHYNSLKERKENVLKRYSREAIAAELDRLVVETSDSCNELKEKFENEELKAPKYVNQLIKLKTLGRLREIKRNRLQ